MTDHGLIRQLKHPFDHYQNRIIKLAWELPFYAQHCFTLFWITPNSFQNLFEQSNCR